MQADHPDLSTSISTDPLPKKEMVRVLDSTGQPSYRDMKTAGKTWELPEPIHDPAGEKPKDGLFCSALPFLGIHAFRRLVELKTGTTTEYVLHGALQDDPTLNLWRYRLISPQEALDCLLQSGFSEDDLNDDLRVVLNRELSPRREMVEVVGPQGEYFLDIGPLRSRAVEPPKDRVPIDDERFFLRTPGTRYYFRRIIQSDSNQWICHYTDPMSSTARYLYREISDKHAVAIFIGMNWPLPPELEGLVRRPPSADNNGETLTAGRVTENPEDVDGEFGHPPNILAPPCTSGEAKEPDRPQWDLRDRELTFKGQRCIFRADACNCIELINAFEASGWVKEIRSPFDDDSCYGILKETIKTLKNKNDIPIYFERNNSKVTWQPRSLTE